jgi:hypothetical protein
MPRRGAAQHVDVGQAGQCADHRCQRHQQRVMIEGNAGDDPQHATLVLSGWSDFAMMLGANSLVEG